MILTKFLFQNAPEEDDERINIKPRRLPKKTDQNENSEDYEDEDNQNAQKSKGEKQPRRSDKV